MEINYLLIGLVVLVVIILIIWLITRNRKDQKDLERKLNQSELNPEKHKEDRI